MSRKIEKTITVPAPVKKVWKTWTTTEGVKSFFAPGAAVELKVGGKFEIYFDLSAPEGERGSEGCRILAYDLERLLMFSWNAPPQYANVRNGAHKTWVILEFHAPEAESTEITLTHLGWKEGEEWSQVYQYFDKAWEKVLGLLEESLSRA